MRSGAASSFASFTSMTVSALAAVDCEPRTGSWGVFANAVPASASDPVAAQPRTSNLRMVRICRTSLRSSSTGWAEPLRNRRFAPEPNDAYVRRALRLDACHGAERVPAAVGIAEHAHLVDGDVVARRRPEDDARLDE